MRWRRAKKSNEPSSDLDTTCKLDTELKDSASSIRVDTPPPTKSISLLALWRYATTAERLWLCLGCMGAIAAGIAQPALTIAFGALVDDFTGFQSGLEGGVGALGDQLRDAVDKNLVILVGVGIGLFATNYVSTLTFAIVGERLARRIRERYLSAFLHSDIAFIESKVGAGEVATRLSSSMHLFQIGVSEKAVQTVQYNTMLFAGITIAFIVNWRMSIVLLSMFPAIGLAGALVMTKGKQVVLDHLSRAGTLAEEAISSIRTVQAYNARERLARLYDEPNDDALQAGRRIAIASGVGIGGFIFVVYSAYALAFWWGCTLFLRGDLEIGDIVTCFFALIVAGASFASMGLQAMSAAAGAATNLYEVIEATPSIDSSSDNGIKLDPSTVRGDIEFRNVSFTYSSRPDRPVLTDFSLHFPANAVTAVTGESGAGKTSIISLIEHFYDVSAGQILLDGTPLNQINVRWLRSQIGLVSQEPTLLAGTVFDNVCHGLTNTPLAHVDEAEKRKLVEAACEKANCTSFIRALPKGLDTTIGERGLRLSGGQRQRVAIARAIVSNPPILLLDEATSALDTRAEAIVQDALDKVSQGRTTITIAHRISTIRNAKLIHCIGQGKILESGTHSELVDAGGAYARIVVAQRLHDLDADQKPSEANEATTEQAETIDDKEEEASNLQEAKTVEAPTKQLYSTLAVMQRLYAMNRQHWLKYLFAIAGAVLQGLVLPIFAIVFGQVLGVFSSTDPSFVRSESNRLAGYIFAIACVGALGISCEVGFFTWTADALSARVRRDAFRAVLRQDPSYFDLDVNSTGALTSQIGDRAEKINLLALNAGFILQSSIALLAGCIVGLSYAWKVALVAMACLPFTIGAGMIQMYTLLQKDAKTEKAHAQASQMAVEAAAAVKTIASLTREDEVVHLYSRALAGPQRQVIRTAVWLQLLASFMQASVFFSIALVYWWGSQLLARGEVEPSSFFIALQAIVFSSIEIAGVFMYIPSLSKCVIACNVLFPLLDAKPFLDLDSDHGQSTKDVRGDMRVEDVRFIYPSRPERPVLQGLSLDASAGKFIGVAGPSGCGKSTLVALLERFYDVNTGRITLDSCNLSSYNLASYRSSIGLVAQEAALYSGTVRDNVLLGSEKRAEDVTAEELETACRSANILNFVKDLSQGFETQLGGKGAQLSGGQRQRMALARALIRRPKMLLLDEATSALDSESERIVEQALYEAAKDRTVISVAHRLSSLKRADAICVVANGRVIEVGSHNELYDLKGAYYQLVVQQNLDR